MANHISHAALPYPIRGCRYTLLVPYLNISGIPVDPTTPDTEISKDAGSFTDCVEEVTTITGSNGLGYITLTGDETDCSMAALAAKVASGPNNTLATLYPRVLAPFVSGSILTATADTITISSNAPNFDIRGSIIQISSGNSTSTLTKKFNQARTIISYNVATKVATVAPGWDGIPSLSWAYTILINETAPAALYCNLTSISGAVLDGTKAQFKADILAVTGINFDTSKAQFGANIVQFTGVPVDTTKAQFGTNLVAIASPTLGYTGVPVNTSLAQLGVNIVNVTGVAANHKYAQFGTNIIEITGYPVNHRYEQFGANTVKLQPGPVDDIWDEPTAGHTTDGTYGEDTYQAKVWMVDDNNGTTDRYLVVWYKNSEPVTTGISNPSITVIKAADGSNLIGPDTGMIEIGSLGMYRYDATGAERITSGSAYIIKVVASINSVTRTWYQPISRDS